MEINSTRRYKITLRWSWFSYGVSEKCSIHRLQIWEFMLHRSLIVEQRGWSKFSSTVYSITHTRGTFLLWTETLNVYSLYTLQFHCYSMNVRGNRKIFRQNRGPTYISTIIIQRYSVYSTFVLNLRSKHQIRIIFPTSHRAKFKRK